MRTDLRPANELDPFSWIRACPAVSAMRLARNDEFARGAADWTASAAVVWVVQEQVWSFCRSQSAAQNPSVNALGSKRRFASSTVSGGGSAAA